MPSLTSRRHVLAGLTGALTAALPMPALLRPARAGAETPGAQPTGPGYARLFPELTPARFDPADLQRLALGAPDLPGMSAEPEVLKGPDGTVKRDPRGVPIVSATPETEQDDEENFGVPAGYTYLGQFIDHDLTLNPVEHFQPMASGETVTNLRTARFDLDSLYARGPGEQPYLYEADGRRLVQGRYLTRYGQPAPNRDLPRVNGRALIGDKRNDENVLVSQLHAAFASFHNAVARDDATADFARLRQIVTHHYQWIVLTDFLPRIVGPALMAELLPGFGEGGRVGSVRPQMIVAHRLRAGDIPLEFADAAYRFGHSMIRPVYRLNRAMAGTAEERASNPALAGRRLIFAASSSAGLNGFRAYPAEWGIDWRLFFEIDRTLDPARIGDGPRRVQAAYKFDTSLVNPLAFLPEFSQPAPDGLVRDGQNQPKPRDGVIANLALRNLLRGQQRGLPSGQAVARALGLDPLPDVELHVGKATCEHLETARPITEYGASFKGAAPLWFYVLAEAQHGWRQAAAARGGDKAGRDALPSRLGPVGGRLVAESMIAMMVLDPGSVLYADPSWTPRFARGGRFTMAELIQTAGLA